jgi:hypothetical protein
MSLGNGIEEATYRCDGCGNEIVTGPFAVSFGTKGPVDVHVPFTCRACNITMVKVPMGVHVNVDENGRVEHD